MHVYNPSREHVVDVLKKTLNSSIINNLISKLGMTNKYSII